MTVYSQTVVNALHDIVQKYGKNILMNKKQTLALLFEYAPKDDLERERNRVSIALNTNTIKILFEAVDNNSFNKSFFDKSVACLIDEADWREHTAVETTKLFANLLGLDLSFLEVDASVSIDAVYDPNSIPERKSSGEEQPVGGDSPHLDCTKITDAKSSTMDSIKSLLKNDMTLSMIITILSIVSVVLLLVFAAPPILYWIIGILSGGLLVAVTIGLSYLFDEHFYIDRNVTTSIIIFALLILNIILRICLPSEQYSLIFRILLVFIIAGAITTNVYYCKTNSNEIFILNIATIIVGVFLLFFWPGDFTWATWQWIIGVFGSAFIVFVVIVIAGILEWLDSEYVEGLSFGIAIITIANFILFLKFRNDYFIIYRCILFTLSIGSIVSTLASFSDDEIGYGIFDIVLGAINLLLFLFVVIGSYDSFIGYVDSIAGWFA